MNISQSFLREDAARSERHKEMTEGVTDPYQRAVLETLMDNVSVAERDMARESNSTASVAVFTRIAKPLLRRMMPALVANRLVSIQPMTLPTTKVFYMDFKYSQGLAPTVAGDRLDYEAGKSNRFYASGVIKGEAVGTGTGSLTTFNLAWHPIRSGSLTVYVNSVVVTNYTIDETTGAIVFAAAPANAATIVADYALDMEQLGSLGNTVIPEIELTMSSATVDAQAQKLKSKWTLEGEQDLRAYHGEEMEDLLTRQMGDELRRELDRLIITDLYTNASAGNVTWSKALVGAETLKEHNETLIHAIGDISNEIYKKRFRHASFVVIAPDTLNLLDKVNSFRLTSGAGVDGAPVQAKIGAGPNVVGTLANRYDVIVDPLFPTNKALVGFKGDTWEETGYVWSPYTAFQTDTFIDPSTMKPVKGLMTRGGRHLVNGDFYGTETLTAL